MSALTNTVLGRRLPMPIRVTHLVVAAALIWSAFVDGQPMFLCLAAIPLAALVLVVSYLSGRQGTELRGQSR
ncbi:MAG TPA: hypothetical protein PLZ93_24955 [Nocardioides sp.]|uniref:hypothetical protein n=1 Tax=uncultured Nocardioides sp. TaxID=198441 RepID=UPI00261FEB5D|nr:hypothetical protein [uncultured Nocardioides sp.]HRD62674.1 hypothetical protein [Nocardioides sp.]HRI98900.1 hypothetical protein [Nocardioides sp.]HRK46029.1 hypothetical protein [Nocardioides sp.]